MVARRLVAVGCVVAGTWLDTHGRRIVLINDSYDSAKKAGLEGERAIEGAATGSTAN